MMELCIALSTIALSAWGITVACLRFVKMLDESEEPLLALKEPEVLEPRNEPRDVPPELEVALRLELRQIAKGISSAESEALTALGEGSPYMSDIHRKTSAELSARAQTITARLGEDGPQVRTLREILTQAREMLACDISDRDVGDRTMIALVAATGDSDMRGEVLGAMRDALPPGCASVSSLSKLYDALKVFDRAISGSPRMTLDYCTGLRGRSAE